ncbi:MAG: hypothetical protein QNJ55_25830 [Xenococcus sp. MO_188.B8]|nr:hypothetical protein [Xenococcus sp. MO_188.B8]
MTLIIHDSKNARRSLLPLRGSNKLENFRNFKRDYAIAKFKLRSQSCSEFLDFQAIK